MSTTKHGLRKNQLNRQNLRFSCLNQENLGKRAKLKEFLTCTM